MSLLDSEIYYKSEPTENREDRYSTSSLEFPHSVSPVGEGSSYEEDRDRPLSRLTIIESPSTSFDQDDDDYDEDDDDRFDLTSPELLSSYRLGGPHTCEECLKTFSSPGKLRQHEYGHTGETPFECNITGCDKKFTSKFKLKRHILIHSQNKRFTCDVCQRAFRRKDHLKNHEKVHDPGKCVYSCSNKGCSRTYNSISSYRKHQAMHSAEEGQLDCKICKMVLQTQEELMTHLKIHAGSRTVKGSSDKKFSCSACDKKFFTRKDLKRHSVVHTGNREFGCPHCTQRFGRKDHMTLHAKKTHAQFYETRCSERTRQTTPLPEHVSEMMPRTARKERSISDPGPMPIFHHQFPETQESSEPPIPVLTVKRPFPGPVIMQSSGPESAPVQASPMYGSTFLHINNESTRPGPSKILVTKSPSSNTEDGQHKNGIIDSMSRVTFPGEPHPGQKMMTGENLLQIPAMAVAPQKTEILQIKVSDLRATLDLPHPGTDLSDSLSSVIPPHSIKTEPGHHLVPHASSENLPKTQNFFVDDNKSQCAETNSDMKNLLAEKSRMDFVTFINDCYNGPDSEATSTTKLYLDPPSPRNINDGDNLFRRLCADEVKMEPESPPASPSPLEQEKINLQTLLSSNLNHHQEQPVAGQIYYRSVSQDYVTKTKNPVLPSVHAEHTLVVPEPKQVNYAIQQIPLDFGEEKDQLTELKGTLFLPEEYSQSIPFQPWI